MFCALNLIAQLRTGGHASVQLESCRSIVVMGRVGQNRMYTLYMTVYLVISLPKIPYINC